MEDGHRECGPALGRDGDPLERGLVDTTLNCASMGRTAPLSFLDQAMPSHQ